MNDDKNNQPAGVTERGTGKRKIPGHIVVAETADPKAKWYVVHTSSGHEVRVMETLRQRIETMNLNGHIFEMLVPTQDRVIIRSGKKATIKEKIFPGYLLVKMILDDSTWLAVRTTAGITGFVGAGDKPTPLSDSEVANILKLMTVRLQISLAQSMKWMKKKAKSKFW
jgi:transcriptional antiterminator NusG